MKGADQCPRCGSRRWATVVAPSDFYSDELQVCSNCKTIWEPFDPADVPDPKYEPLGAFKQPCGNCAFRKGSPEQQSGRLDKIRPKNWQGPFFFCHKGVPIDPEHPDGFAYPGGGKDGRKLRLCRGYLNALPKPEPYCPEDIPDQTWTDTG